MVEAASPAPAADAVAPLSAPLKAACAIAAGDASVDNAVAISVVAAKKDLNCKGRGPEWHRVVWRAGQWRYFAAGHLPSGSFRASERRASVHGDVYEGEIVARHERGGPIDTMWVVVDSPRKDGQRGSLHEIDFVKQKDGLRIVLPTGTHVTVPNPRR